MTKADGNYPAKFGVDEYIKERDLFDKRLGKKTCLRCEKAKERREFGLETDRKDGLCRYCKNCMSEMNSKKYKDNKKRIAKLKELDELEELKKNIKRYALTDKQIADDIKRMVK